MGTPLPHIPLPEFSRRLESSAFAEATVEGIVARIDRVLLAELLWTHYQELRRWNPKLSLVGPGTAAEVVERHYLESLAGLQHLRATDHSLVDVGTGGGFPGLVLGLAASLAVPAPAATSAPATSASAPPVPAPVPEPPAQTREPMHVLLVEPRQRKWSFLHSVLRLLRQRFEELCPGVPLPWSCQAVSARVERPLPGVLQHALQKLSERAHGVHVVTTRALAFTPDIWEPLLQTDPDLRFLLWTGAELPALPPHSEILRVTGRASEVGAGTQAFAGAAVQRSIVELAMKRTDLGEGPVP